MRVHLFCPLESVAALLAELLKEVAGLLIVIHPLAHGGLEMNRDVYHGGFAVEGLAEAEGTVLGLVVGGAAAGGLAAAACHRDEAAVQEALGLGQELVEFAAELPLLGRQRGWTDRCARHGCDGSTTLLY